MANVSPEACSRPPAWEDVVKISNKGARPAIVTDTLHIHLCISGVLCYENLRSKPEQETSIPLPLRLHSFTSLLFYTKLGICSFVTIVAVLVIIFLNNP